MSCTIINWVSLQLCCNVVIPGLYSVYCFFPGQLDFSIIESGCKKGQRKGYGLQRLVTSFKLVYSIKRDNFLSL